MGTLALLVPLFGTFVLWLWSAWLGLVSIQTFCALLGLVVVVSATLVSIEAHALGMGVRADARGRVGSGPVAWFFAVSLCWLFAFPWYLDQRRHYGRAALGVPAVLAALVFASTCALVGGALAEQEHAAQWLSAPMQ
jgi:hypothetical protein